MTDTTTILAAAEPLPVEPVEPDGPHELETGTDADARWIACTDEDTRASVPGFEVRRYGTSTILGLWRLEHGDSAEYRVGSAVWLRGMARDADGLDWCSVIDFIDHDRVRRRWLMPRDVLAGDRVEILRQLLRRGFDVSSGKEARDALHAYVSAAPCTRFTTVRSAGWQGEAFVMGSRTIGPGNYLMADPPPDAVPEGDLASWRRSVATPSRGNTRLVFSISCGLVSPLLRLADVESGGVHLVGGSSIGKSTAAHVARSVWGKGLQTWRVTDNGMEAIAARHSDMSIVLDEIGQADGRVVGEMAYMLANGQGKGRASRDGTDRARQTWRLFPLSTGETTIGKAMSDVGKQTKAGQEVRLATVEADADAGLGLFENTHGAAPDAFADALVAASARHHGTAGPAFVERLVADTDAALAAVETARTEFAQRHRLHEADGQVQRVARRFALVAAAGELATWYGLTGWENGEATVAALTCFTSWRDSWTPSGSRENERAIEQVRAFLQTQSARFESGADGDDRHPVRDRAGFRVSGETGGEWLIFPKVFREEVSEGLRAEQIADALEAAGYLVTETAGGRRVRQVRRRVGGARQRVYAVRDAILEGDDDAR